MKSPKAEAFCALGALRRVNTKHQERAEHFLSQAVLLQRGYHEADLKDMKQSRDAREEYIVRFNDTTHSRVWHRKVLALFTKAVQLARKWEASNGRK